MIKPFLILALVFMLMFTPAFAAAGALAAPDPSAGRTLDRDLDPVIITGKVHVVFSNQMALRRVFPPIIMKN